MANNDTVNTVYVEHDSDVISLEEVKAVVITDHILMYNNSTIDRAENIKLDDIIDGLNNFVDYNILISNIVYSKNQNAFKV